MNPEEEKTIPVQAADADLGRSEPESAANTVSTDQTPANVTAAQASYEASQTAGSTYGSAQGYPQNPNAQFNGAQGYPQNPNAQFNGAQGYPQNPNAQFNGAQGYPQNPNAQFNGVQGYPQNPNAQFNGAQGYPQNPNAQFNGAQGYPQNPNAQFNGVQGYPQNPNAQFNGAQGYPQNPNAQFNGAQGYPQNPNAQFNGAQGYPQNPNTQFNGAQGYPQNSNAQYGSAQSFTQGFQNMTGSQQGYQNPYYVNPASVPPVQQKKKSKKKIWIPVVSVVLAAAIAIGVYFLVSKKTRTPEDAVATAMASTFSAERTETATGWLNSQDLSKLAQSGSYQINWNMNIDELSGSLADEISMLEGIGFSSSTALDLNAARYFGSGSILYEGTSYLDYALYAYDDYIALACPDLFEGYLEFKTSSFGIDFNNSPLAEALDTSVDPTLAFQFFELFSTASETEPEVPREFQDFLDSIRYEEGDKKDLQVNGKTQTCQGYRIVVPHESIENLFRWFCEYADELGTHIDYDGFAQLLPHEDFVMNVYVDSKGRMARFAFTLPIEAAQTEINCQIDFTGLGDNPADHVTGSLTMNIEGYAYGFSFESTTNTSGTTTTQNTNISIDVSGISVANATYASTFDTQTKTAHADLSVSAMYTSILSMNMDYSYTDIVPGECFTVNIDDLTFDIAGELTVGLSGSSTVSKLNGPVAEPSGTKYDLFTITEDDFIALTEETAENIMNGPLGFLFVEFYTDLPTDFYYSTDFPDDPYGEADW